MAGVGIIHPGAMGSALGDLLTAQGTTVFWCAGGRSAATAQRAQASGLLPVADLGSLVERCEVILSVCPPEFAEQLAAAVAACGFSGTYVDANAIAPQRMRQVARLLPAARVVDGSVIGPPPRQAGTTRLYLCGEAAGDVAQLFGQTAVETVVLDNRMGSASALKMAFAASSKGAGGAGRALPGAGRAPRCHSGAAGRVGALSRDGGHGRPRVPGWHGCCGLEMGR